MELWPDSGLRVYENDRERDVVVVSADELMGVWLVRQFVQVENPGHGHLRPTLTLPTVGHALLNGRPCHTPRPASDRRSLSVIVTAYDDLCLAPIRSAGTTERRRLPPACQA